MKTILVTYIVTIHLSPLLLVFLLSGCASLTTPHADRTWEHVGEPWTQRPPTGPDTARTVDADGNPSFGPK
jgi:hypothetical protein